MFIEDDLNQKDVDGFFLSMVVLSASVINYQVSIDALEYLLDPIGVVSALGTTVDRVRVSAVSERAGRDFGYTHI